MEGFLESIPKDKKARVIKRIDYLISELKKSKYNFKDLPRSFSIRKVEGRKYPGDIFKFRVEQGNADRVIFTFNSEVKNVSEELGDAMVFIEYCSHDRQIVKGRNINLSDSYKELTPLEQEQLFEQAIDNAYTDFEYNINEIISIVVGEEELEKYLGRNDKRYLYHLNSEQFQCLSKKDMPLLLFGSAGSGKTTIGVYKLYLLAKDNRYIGYFTYTNRLRNEAQQIFNEICRNFGTESRENRVEFHALEEFCMKQCMANGLVKHGEFCEWLKSEWRIKRGARFPKLKFSSIEIWKEIRGIIKGFIGVHWTRSEEFEEKSIRNETIEFLGKNNFIVPTLGSKYKIIEGKSKIKEKITYSKEVNKELLLSDVNNIFVFLHQSVYKKKLLDLDIYLSLKEDYSIYSEEERRQIYQIAELYQSWLNETGKVDDNDLSLMTIKKIDEGIVQPLDFIVLDEIQDLTELQIYLIYCLVNEKHNVFFSGDFNQTINPTFFNTGRVENLFKSNSSFSKFYPVKLRRNYRSNKQIIALANKLSEIRINRLEKDKRNDYIEQSRRDGEEKPFMLLPTNENKKQLIETALQRDYVAIIVPDEEEKIKLENEFGIKNITFTVQEIKGIEYEYVICYNVISKNLSCWNDIFSNNLMNKSKYRLYFNLFYVAITRARDNLCLYEENINEELLSEIRDFIKLIYDFNLEQLCFSRASTEEEFYHRAIYLEKNENYEQAIELFKKSNVEKSKVGITRCKAKILAVKGKYLEAAERMMDIKEYAYAADYYKFSGDYLHYLKAAVFNKEEYHIIDKEFQTIKKTPLRLLVKEDCEDWYTLFKENYLNPKLKAYEEQFSNVENKLSEMKENMKIFKDKFKTTIENGQKK